jgi:hypothetical protein
VNLSRITKFTAIFRAISCLGIPLATNPDARESNAPVILAPQSRIRFSRLCSNC